MGESRKKTRRHRGRRKKNKRSVDVVSTLILIVAACVFCYAGFQLFKIFKGYYDGRSEYEKVQDLALDGKEKDKFRIDFDELLKINPDTKGWIRFSPEPAVINYPLVQGKDNEEYLDKTFSANENTLGAIFINADNKDDFSDRNTIIYGHRMKDGSMFRHLQDYEEKAFWEANPYFYIYTLDGREITYHIFAAGLVKETADIYRTQFPSDEEYQQFLSMAAGIGEYETNVELKPEDTVITLSTCTSANDDNRFVVCGVKEKEVVLED